MILGTESEAASCEVVLQDPLQVLESELASASERPIAIISTDVYGVQGDARHAALDALIGGATLPYVIVNGALVCTGGIDVAATLERVRSL
jgi:hypothetical protein